VNLYRHVDRAVKVNRYPAPASEPILDYTKKEDFKIAFRDSKYNIRYFDCQPSQ